MKRKWAGILVGAALIVGPSQAVASGSGPPDTYLRHGGEQLQRGEMGTHCWSGDGVAWCADAHGYYFPRRAAYVPAGDKARIRIGRAERPESFRLVGWRKVDSEGQPLGRSRRLATDLKAVREDGHVIGWDAVFETPSARSHLYLDAFVRWDRGDAMYDFHLKTKE